MHRLDPRGWSTTDRLVALAVLAVLIAPVLAAVQALAHGWQPNGDDATIALRTADILDGRFPVTGMRSTSGDGVDPSLSTHHLGPLQFYLLALPLALTGGSAAGLVLGGALIAATASVLSVVWARRLGGALAVTVFTCGVLLTQWAIGPEALFRPFNPYAPLLPVHLALILLWALARGDRRALPPFVVAVSLTAQSNLAFLPLAVLLALAAAALLLWPRTTRGRRRRRVRAHTVSHRWALGLGVLVWLPSLVELVVNQPNNLGQLIRWATSGTGTPIGVVNGAAHLSLIAPVPGGFRRYTEDLLVDGSGLATAVGVAMLVLLVAISTGYKVPRGRASSVWPARVALVANLGMLATASRLPEWPLAPYWVITWLPVAAFTWAALAWRGLAYLADATPHLPARIALPLAGALVVGSIVSVPLAHQPDWTETDAMTRVARLAGEDLGPGENRAVQINGLGFVPTLGAAPAIAWQAHRQGWEPYYLRTWPFPEDAEHLWGSSAPGGATRLYIVDSTQPELHSGLPPSARRVGTVEMRHREGELGVYRDLGD
ncbi:hypothetical protein [Janibacter limosus]|uniref:Glycosyltransferase RgtA/B/C/D-like domain-containing protein n=1 Tax=Janibacter limosus TaxID=53458 RepID=A0A4P6MVI4_9MICO|nr:hypothetical protein [Janibacter limosus]QBF45817.1 hypothetical protein EXU32_05835 [Janibacter limosus]